MKKTLMPQNLITPDELAIRWKLTTRTLAQWRYNGGGPKFIKIGNEIFYRVVAIENFEESREQRTTSTPLHEVDTLPHRMIASGKKKLRSLSGGEKA